MPTLCRNRGRKENLDRSGLRSLSSGSFSAQGCSTQQENGRKKSHGADKESRLAEHHHRPGLEETPTKLGGTPSHPEIQRDRAGGKGQK